jgi:hypothetical protein
MIKTVEVIVIIALLIFSFFLGVKYSNSVKSHMSWLETQDEQEVELPDLSNESNGEVVGGPSDADINNPPALDNVNVDSSGQPLPAEGAIDESTPQAVEPVAVPVPANAPANQAR